MRDILVAIDLETTGLNAQEDRIIEIGAVKFRGNEVIETYRTLVDPERPIPPRVTSITGIRPDDVRGAPKIADVIADVVRFVGDHLIVGHNINFDIEFLKQNGAPFSNPTIDTYELASALLPTTPRYNLNALMQELQLEAEGDYHSALADSLATSKLYEALWQRLLNAVPYDTLQDIVTATRNLQWQGRPAFEAALRERSLNHKRDEALAPTLPRAEPDVPALSLMPNPERQPLNIDQIAQRYAEYRASIGQPDTHTGLLREAADALSMGTNLVAEAAVRHDASADKTLPYLLPAIAFAVQNNERVVISTHSTELQQQLLEIDIPRAAQILGTPVNAVRLKSRANYLCPRRVETLRRRPPTSIEELRVLAKILVWSNESATGDRDDISLRGPAEYVAWSRLSAQDEDCALQRCEAQSNGTCPFYRARRAADSAHIVLVNHALLMSDAPGAPLADSAAAGPNSESHRVLPEYHHVILDEAHHLEDDATFALGTRLDLAGFKRQLADTGTLRTGILGDLLSVIKPLISDTMLSRTTAYVKNIADAVEAMEHHGDSLFESLAALVQSVNPTRGDYLVQIRVSDELRDKNTFEAVRAAWANLREFTGNVAEAMLKLAQSLITLESKASSAELADLLASITAASEHLITVHRQLTALIDKPEVNTIYWLEIAQDQTYPTIRTAPLHVGPLAQQSLWKSKRTVILTSDTLRTGNSFDYIKDRLHVPEDTHTAVFNDPFGYEETTLLYMPNDIPEPQDKNRYQQTVEKGIIALASATEGKLFALFTNYAQLRQTAQAVTPRLALGNITLFDQSDGTSRQVLLDGFRTAEKRSCSATKPSGKMWYCPQRTCKLW